MKKSAIVLFFAALLTSASLFAQNIQEGISHFYAERYQSARSIFEKSNNAEATYWLGQTLIENNDVAGARALYEKALAANANAPLILVGMGHVELLEGKMNEARQRFETATTLSRGRKGDDPNVLNAIGRANVSAKGGDVAYAISKLQAAAQIAPNNPYIQLNLGNAYRKAHEGGNAVQAYMKAVQANPNFAPAFYRMARLYETQRNWEVFTQNLNRAIQADPKFAPAYQQLYYYTLLYQKDFAKAEQYANQFIANTDPSPQNDYIKAQTAFVQKKYDEAINMAKNIVSAAGEQTRPIVYRLLAYSTLEKGDTTAACEYVGQFFTKAKDEDVVGQDYILQADACGRGNPDVVVQSYLKAVEEDTVMANKLKFLQEGIDRAKAAGQKSNEAALRLAAYNLRPDHNPAELFQIGLPYYQGGEFQKADSVFKAYSAAFPDSIYGYYWSARSLSQIDTTMEQGIAVPDYEKTLEIAARDTARFKSMGVTAAGYLAGYHNNIKTDRTTAIEFLQKGLQLDPANASLQSSLQALQRAGSRSGSTAGAKTKTKSEGDGDTKTKTKSEGGGETKTKTKGGQTKVKSKG